MLDDAIACLSEVDDPDLLLMRAATERAIAALRDGHDWAAQALAASTFSSASHTLFALGMNAIRKRMEEEDPKEAGISQFRLRTIFLAGSKALAVFDPAKDPEGVGDFNRHNSAHRITAAQWTEANALSGIMLASALLREMQYWYGVEPDTPDDSE